MNDTLTCGHDFSPSNYRLQGAVHQCYACHRERMEARRTKNRERDDAIVADHRAGVSKDVLAKTHRLCLNRIYNIIRANTPQLNSLTNDPLFPERAMQRAAELSNTRVEELKSHWREKHLVKARWCVMAAMHERGVGYKSIGRRLGGRDHTTIIYGVRQAGIFSERSPEFRAMLDQVRAA